MSAMRNTPNLECQLHTPEALKGDGVNCLPPYAEVQAHSVAEFTACPDSWVRGTGNKSSFFVPVVEGRGMWLDFNQCARHTHDVAVLVSVQGINPVTGQPVTENKLAQYLDACPVHDAAFGEGRFCPECEYKWAKQNYICTTGTPIGQLWIDGFRGDDGVVRQYLFTKDETRGVAAQLLGESRAFAIGISFFLSKKAKPPRPAIPKFNFHSSPFGSDASYPGVKYSAPWGTPDLSAYCSSSEPISSALMQSTSGEKPASYGAASGILRSTGMSQVAESRVEVERLEIAGGAQIRQDVWDDPETLDYWEAEPESIIYVNYANQADVASICARGKRQAVKDGALAGLKVGN